VAHLSVHLILSPSHTDIIFHLTTLNCTPGTSACAEYKHTMQYLQATSCSYLPSVLNVSQQKPTQDLFNMWQSHGNSKPFARLDNVWLGPMCCKIFLKGFVAELNLVFQEKHSVTRTSSSSFWQNYFCCRQYLQIFKDKGASEPYQFYRQYNH
jgi:hypothetical protein